MIGVIAGLTFRSLAGRRRVIAVSLLGALPILLALMVRLTGRSTGLDTITATVMDRLVVSTLVPLIALVFGTSALGSELDDGTAVYLLAKPIARWRIVVAKVLVAAGLAVLVTAPAAFIAALILGGSGGLTAAFGFAVGAAVAATLYVVIFLALSLVTGRALAIGLVYILVWEGVLAGLFAGTRSLSIRQYALGVADAIAGGGRASVGTSLPGSTAVVSALIVGIVALAIAILRLRSYEVGEAD